MPDLYDLLNRLADWQNMVEEIGQFIDSLDTVGQSRPIRPNYKCPVKINTTGFHHKPYAVARSMRRNGGK